MLKSQISYRAYYILVRHIPWFISSRIISGPRSIPLWLVKMAIKCLRVKVLQTRPVMSQKNSLECWGLAWRRAAAGWQEAIVARKGRPTERMFGLIQGL